MVDAPAANSAQEEDLFANVKAPALLPAAGAQSQQTAPAAPAAAQAAQVPQGQAAASQSATPTQDGRRYEAWAYGMALPSTLGSSGFSASGWIVIANDKESTIVSRTIPSRASNRRDWAALIMAVKGVFEEVQEGAAVTLRLHETTIANATKAGFQNTRGRPMAGEEFWGPMEALKVAKRLTVEVQVAAPDDDTMAQLKVLVRQAALTQLETAGEEAALRDALPPRAKRARGGTFPQVEGYEEKPRPIQRKRLKATRKGRGDEK